MSRTHHVRCTKSAAWRTAAWLPALLLVALMGCSTQAADDNAGRRSTDPTAPSGPPETSTATARTASGGDRTTTPTRLTAEAVIEQAERPVAGTVSGRRVLLLYATRAAAAIRVRTADGVVDRLLDATAPRYSWEEAILTPFRGRVAIVLDGRNAWLVSPGGDVSSLAFSSIPTPPAAGDVLVNRSEPTLNGRGGPAFTPSWLLRPATRTVLTRPAVPAGAHLTHMDHHGTLWAIARPRHGQSVLLSTRSRGTWVRHVVGRYSPTFHGCACDTDPGPHGRGGVLVLAGNPLQHVSTDHGQTWRTYDVSASTPYRTVLSGSRFPRVSALADGRLVIGYEQFWVADDPSNTSFTKSRHPLAVLRAADLLEPRPLLFRGDQTSPDGGRTWARYR